MPKPPDSFIRCGSCECGSKILVHGRGYDRGFGLGPVLFGPGSAKTQTGLGIVYTGADHGKTPGLIYTGAGRVSAGKKLSCMGAGTARVGLGPVLFRPGRAKTRTGPGLVYTGADRAKTPGFFYTGARRASAGQKLSCMGAGTTAVWVGPVLITPGHSKGHPGAGHVKI